MSLLLLVRSADDMRSAAKAASELVAYLRQRFAGDREIANVVGIWLKRDLDAELPAWPWADDRQLGAGLIVGPPDKRSASKIAMGEAGLGIRESFSISGIWTLCWIDGTLFRSAQGSAERRNAVLRTLVDTARASSQNGAFFPVFGARKALPAQIPS